MSEPQTIAALGVYQVFTGGGTGSGFLIAPNLLLTNCHVVAPYRMVAIEKRDRRRIIGHVRRLSPKRDLAVVELTEPLDGKLLSLAPSDSVLSVKQPVHIVGFPVGLPLSLTEGVISNPKQLLDGQEFVQTDAAINPGNSGGPIFDADWRVVAVTTCKLQHAENVGFGVPCREVHEFLDGFAEQEAPFGVLCPSCDALLASAERYCDNCGSDLDALDLPSYFAPEPLHPVVAFVEEGLQASGVNPVLARHGSHNWSFYSGSALIKIWSCCSEHMCIASPLAQPGKQHLGELFRFLLKSEHEPLSFDLAGGIIRLHTTVHMADVFSPSPGQAAALFQRFTAEADRLDNLLTEQYGCRPAPETQLDELAAAPHEHGGS